MSGVETLVDPHGRACGAEPTMALCRCGHSGSKPFCDGAHVSHGFTGELRTDFPAKRDYVGRDVTVSYNKSICAHVGICTTRLGTVFNVKARPWIQPSAAGADDTRNTVDACPSGALTYPIQDDQPTRPNATPAIRVLKNGPMAVTGVELSVTQRADGATRDHYTLCRCGGSRSMPFCDGTHASIGFRDDPPYDRAEAATDANDIVMASFSRSLTDGDFATTFYDTLFETEESLRELFAGTDFEVQKPLLRHAVEVMIRFGAGDEGARAEIERLAERHARDDLNINPTAYTVWLDVLCATLRRHDPEFGPGLELAWREHMQVGIDVMRSRY